MEDIKEDIKEMEDGDSKELLKAAYKASLKKSREEGKQKTKVSKKNVKMRKMFKSFSKLNKGVRG
jgi:high-affinity K+ transport system ATPase subunit B